MRRVVCELAHRDFGKHRNSVTKSRGLKRTFHDVSDSYRPDPRYWDTKPGSAPGREKSVIPDFGSTHRRALFTQRHAYDGLTRCPCWRSCTVLEFHGPPGPMFPTMTRHRPAVHAEGRLVQRLRR
jgi:hypothetical protein